MDRTETDFGYSTRRAREEALRSLSAHSDVASRAHWRLSILHAARAALALQGGS